MLFLSSLDSKKERNCHNTFSVFKFMSVVRNLCITCTVHRTVISIEHFDIASAGFFALLASFAVQTRDHEKGIILYG